MYLKNHKPSSLVTILYLFSKVSFFVLFLLCTRVVCIKIAVVVVVVKCKEVAIFLLTIAHCYATHYLQQNRLCQACSVHWKFPVVKTRLTRLALLHVL